MAATIHNTIYMFSFDERSNETFNVFIPLKLNTDLMIFKNYKKERFLKSL